MIIKPTIKKCDKISNELHCGKCGKVVPFEAKYLTSLFEQKVQEIDKWHVFISYICGYCSVHTTINFLRTKSSIDVFERINLYGEYKK